MIKRPVFALTAAAIAGILLSGSGIAALMGVLCAYACMIFLFFILSDRFKDLILKIIKPSKYLNLIIFFGLLPLVFVLAFWRGKAYERSVLREREPYRIMHENAEDLCIVSGRVKDVDLSGKHWVLTLEDCVIKGFLENVERPAGGCVVYLDEETAPKCGNSVHVYGKYYFIEEQKNPGEYNGFPGAVKKRIYGRVYAKKIRITDTDVSHLRHAVSSMSVAFENSLLRIFNEDDSGILISMITGNKGFKTEEMTELYRRAGIGHILSISGLHVSLLILGLWRLLKRAAVGRFGSAAIATSFLVFFLFFTGFSVSTARAGVMCCVFLLGRVVRKHYDMPSALGAAVIAIVFVWPYEIHDPAFVLSVAAICGVCFAESLGGGYLFGMAVTAFTLPVSAYFFFEIPTYSFIANLIVVPLTGVLLVTGIFAGMIGCFSITLGRFFGGMAFMLLRIIEAVSGFVSGLPFSTILTGRPAWYEVGVIYACLISFCFLVKKYGEVKKERKNRDRAVILWGRAACVSLVLLLIFAALPDGESITFLSVGQGDCCVFLNEKWGFGALDNGHDNGKNGHVKTDSCAGDNGDSNKKLLLSVGAKENGDKKALVNVGEKENNDIKVLVSVGEKEHGNKNELMAFKTRDCVVFDCGSTSENEVGKRILQPFLKSEGVMLIDKVTVSHTDEDHISGILEILENMNVYKNDLDYAMRYKGNVGIRTLVMPLVKERGEAYNRLLELAEKKGVKVEFIRADDELVLNDRNSRLLCLSPFDAEKSENETSLVFFLETPDHRALFMGDAGTETEGKLLKNGKLQELIGERGGIREDKPSSDGLILKVGDHSSDGLILKVGHHGSDGLILKVGHHGSRTASSLEFLERLRPDVAVISCGHGNTYGHPHDSVVRALEAVGAEIRRTDLEGAVWAR